MRLLWYRFIRWIVRWGFFWLGGGFRIHGRENVPKDGPLLVAPIHVSNLDPPATACAMPRPITFMAKSELFKGIFGKLIQSLGAFPVHRGEADTEAIRLALELLKQGRAVLIFPEGTRGNGREIQPMTTGVALLAKRSGAAVLPVGIAGTHKRFPKGKAIPGFGRVSVRFGPVLRYADFTAEFGEKPGREAFLKALSDSLIALCGEDGLSLAPTADGTTETTKSSGARGPETESPPVE